MKKEILQQAPVTRNFRPTDVAQTVPPAAIGFTTGIKWQEDARSQSEQLIKITRDAQPEHGFTTALYSLPAIAQPEPPVGGLS